MKIERWVSGYKAVAEDWFDGNSIYFSVEYFRPGQSVNSGPEWSKAFLIPKHEENKISEYFDSVAVNLALETDERRMLAWYVGKTKIVENGVRIA